MDNSCKCGCNLTHAFYSLAVGETLVIAAGKIIGKFKSKSSPGTTYTVKDMGKPSGKWKDKIVCNCPSYIYRGYCRHAIDKGNKKAAARRKKVVKDK